MVMPLVVGRYDVRVYFPDDPLPHATIPVLRPSDVMACVPRVLAGHEGCDHVSVFFDGVRLFGVDPTGDHVP